jgi:nitroimidazol reductase NimA-like FMN-containing flavoprotein (pyridoxamine 5'-phosphate oxidase superfamily)
VNRRAAIAMTPDEVVAFLAEQRTLTCATLGRDGWPHLMPLWYVIRATQPTSSAGTRGELWAWTYAKSQKVRNLERDPRCTLQVEAGTTYDQLRGVMLKAEAVIHREFDVVAALGEEIAVRYGGAALDDGAREYVHRQAAKRVALQFRPRESATWDHRKL